MGRQRITEARSPVSELVVQLWIDMTLDDSLRSANRGDFNEANDLRFCPAKITEQTEKDLHIA